MDWHKNKKGIRITKKLSLYKGYLGRLQHLDHYKKWLKTESKRDNITTIKSYFNTFIFIHIMDFKRGDYNLWKDKSEFKEYVKKNPYSRKKAKTEKLNIMLHEVCD